MFLFDQQRLIDYCSISQPLEFQPSPLSNTEVDEYLLALKQEFRAGMEDSQYFVKSNVKSNGIEVFCTLFSIIKNQLPLGRLL